MSTSPESDCESSNIEEELYLAARRQKERYEPSSDARTTTANAWTETQVTTTVFEPVMSSPPEVTDVLLLLVLLTLSSLFFFYIFYNISRLVNTISIIIIFIATYYALLLSNVHFLCVIFTQRRSVAKSVRCFQRRLFVCVFVCCCVCQHDNFRTSKHRMMKLGGRCVVQKSRPSSNLRVIAPPKMWRLAMMLGKSAQAV